MPDYLFTYGTLLPGLVPRPMAAAMASLQPLGPAWMRGRLYDLGRYPGAICDPASGGKIWGEVFGLADGRAVLKTLDAYEGYSPAKPAESLFVRRRLPATLADGRRIRCWVYLYGHDRGTAPLVPHGDYRRFMRHRKAQPAPRS